MAGKLSAIVEKYKAESVAALGEQFRRAAGVRLRWPVAHGLAAVIAHTRAGRVVLPRTGGGDVTLEWARGETPDEVEVTWT